MGELKPCPFCGSDEDYLAITDEDIPFTILKCCSFQREDYISSGEMIREWNNRPIEDALEARVKELKLALADAIRRPMGVIPDSADGLITDQDIDNAECRRQGIKEKEMKVTTFDGGHYRKGEISVERAICDVCARESVCIVIDASEDEYESGKICEQCTAKAFTEYSCDRDDTGKQEI